MDNKQADRNDCTSIHTNPASDTTLDVTNHNPKITNLMNNQNLTKLPMMTTSTGSLTAA